MNFEKMDTNNFVSGDSSMESSVVSTLSDKDNMDLKTSMDPAVLINGSGSEQAPKLCDLKKSLRMTVLRCPLKRKLDEIVDDNSNNANDPLSDDDDNLSDDMDDDDNGSISFSSDELEDMLNEGLPEDFRRVPIPNPKRKKFVNKKQGEADLNEEGGDFNPNDSGVPAEDERYNEKEITVLIEKGRNTLEVLPNGWIEIRHTSGMPLYLHRKTRVCCMSKPYNLGPASVRRHSIPISAIPCLAYRKAIEREKEMLRPNPLCLANSKVQEPSAAVIENAADTTETNPNSEDKLTDQDATIEDSTSTIIMPPNVLPLAKLETAEENNSMYTVTPQDVRSYCRNLFHFKDVQCKRFKTWSARRKYSKDQKRIQLERPTLPEGVKLIVFPVHSAGNDANSNKGNKEYIMNPQGKSSVCILHEYVQHALRKQPSYTFKELENAASPYSATVVINGMQYGTGFGSSKKQAKSDAARVTLEILIPEMKEQLNESKVATNADIDVTDYFKQVDLRDSRITKMCAQCSEPSPYSLLLTCMQRNFGQAGSEHVKFQMICSGNQTNRFRMEAGQYVSDLVASNKREGKQMASLDLLAQIHPNITNFGSILKLYGNGSIRSVKEKKQDEQQITTLQSKASANSPNYAILDKLKQEMLKLKNRQNLTAAVPSPPPLLNLPPPPPPRSLQTSDSDDSMSASTSSS